MRRLILLALLVTAACGNQANVLGPVEEYEYSLSYVDYSGVFWHDCYADLTWMDSSGASCWTRVTMAEPLVAVGFIVPCAAWYTDYELRTRNHTLLSEGRVEWRQTGERRWVAVIVFASTAAQAAEGA